MVTTKKPLIFKFVEVLKMFRRLDELTRENRELRSRLETAADQVDAFKAENEDLLQRLADYENYYARERTAGLILSSERY